MNVPMDTSKTILAKKRRKAFFKDGKQLKILGMFRNHYLGVVNISSNPTIQFSVARSAKNE